MRFWRKLAAILVALPFLATAALAQTAVPTAPDRERLALAREMLDAIQPPAIDAVGLRMSEQVMQQILMSTIGFSGGAPELDETQLYQSFEVGAAVGAEQSREIFVDRYAREMTDEDMRAVIAFYTSPEGRAGLNATAGYLDQYLTLLENGDQQELEQMVPYAPPPASVAFSESAAGQALARTEASDSLKEAGVDLVQNQIAAAQVDYCAHAVCGEAQNQLFRNVGAMVAFDRMGGEHAMFGMTAGDLFFDPKAAKLARAACLGDAAAVAAAVGDGADPNSIGGEGSGPGGSSQRVTPLLWAIDCGSVTGVEALLDAGADPNQREEFGATPVTVAAETREPAILQRLLTRGGDANAHDGRETALQIALKLASRLERVDGLPEAKAWANWDALLAAGADPDRIAPDGAPLMQTASFMNQWKKVVWLIDRGWAGDPVDLGRTIETAQGQRGIPQDELDALAQVRAELVRRGVKFPIGALIDLPRDDRGFYIQR
jgi:hypothetical protein